MQIFVKHPENGRTLIYNCSPETTVADFSEWVYDYTRWPKNAYFVLYNGRPLPLNSPEYETKTLGELNVKQEDTLHLIGRMSKN
jgi:hypothetical protein